MSNLSPDIVLPENFCANPQEAWTIPARFYTDQNAFEHEKENVFAKSWICVAHSSEPRQPGGCKLKTAPVRPVVAARPAEYVCSEDLFY